jgi:tetratricopeptide (TPR) repeat protein
MKRLIVLIFAALLAAPALSAAASIAELKAAADAAAQAATNAPSDYTANWTAAMALRKYGDELVTQKAPEWKNLANAAATEGMKFGEIAQKLNPAGVEGWYWYGLCVGTHSDCVSVFSALAEGLKAKTQKAFETAYALDKNYDTGSPILALGRFWQVLPGIAGRDLKKAEKLFDEYIAAFGSSPDANKDTWYFRGALYKETHRIPEARADLEKAASMGQKDAPKLLAELK